MKKIILLGSGGHAKSVLDTIERNKEYEIQGFISNDKEFVYREYKVIGNDDYLEYLYASGVTEAFLAIGFMGKGCLRNQLYDKLKKIGFHLPVIVDKSAIISRDVILEEGVFIGKNCVVNANSIIKKCAIINTGAIVEHDCHIGSFSHVSVNSVVCGTVKIGKNVFLGANTTIVNNITIADNINVKAAECVKKDILNQRSSI